MKKDIRIGIALMFMAISLQTVAQNEIDALRYSSLGFGGSARYTAMGGAFSSLGADISGLSTNPATIGIYRKGEITFSPSLYNSFTNTDYLGSSSSDYDIDLNVDHGGLILTFNNSASSQWKYFSLGIGYNRQQNFDASYQVYGVNNSSSLLDVYKEDIENNIYDEFGSNMAWQLLLVDTMQGNPDSIITRTPGYGYIQTENQRVQGSIGETVLSYGGNWNHRIYIGGSIGFPRIRYTNRSTYQEDYRAIFDPQDSLLVSKGFVLNENLVTTGTGINAKFGIIGRLNDYVRVGAAIHTPTSFRMTDSWDASLEATYLDTNNQDAQYYWDSPEGTYNYRLITPYRAIGSISFIIGKMGVFSAEYEFVDYSFARLQSRGNDTYTFNGENQAIRDKYKATGNLRTGLEVRLDPVRLRAGYAFYGNPYRSDVTNKRNQHIYSAGIGVRWKHFYCDFAYRISTQSDRYYLYDSQYSEAVSRTSNNHDIITTVGFRF